jgi:hypothetical protein
MKRFIYLLLAVAVLAKAPQALGNRNDNGSDNSGLKGKTISIVYGGAEHARAIERTYSMEFAIAPVDDGNPVYEKAILVKSDEQGKFEVALPPGKYWIGPKKKALDQKSFESSAKGPMIFREKVVAVKKDGFTHVDVILEGYAP